MLPMIIGIVTAIGGYFLVARAASGCRRGVVVAIVSALQFLGWSQVVPLDIRNAVIVGSLILLTLAALAPRVGPPRRAVPVLVLTAAYFGTGLVATYLGYPEGTGMLLRLAGLSIMLVVVVRRFTASDLRALLDGLLASAFLQAVFGLIELVIGEPVLWGYKTYESGRALFNENPLFGGDIVRIQGTASHWIPFAVLISAGVLALVIGWRRYHPVVRLLGVALFPICLVLSGARSAMLGLIAALVVLLAGSVSAAAVIRNTLLAIGTMALLVVAAPDIATGVDEFLSTGSFLNRMGNVAAAPGLVDRPFIQSFFGSGADSQAGLFAQGLLLQNGFDVIDNQLVTTLATQGVLGLGLLLALLVVGFVRAGRVGRAFILMMAALMFSFDYFTFTSMLTLLFVFLPLAASDADERFIVEPTPGEVRGRGPSASAMPTRALPSR